MQIYLVGALIFALLVAVFAIQNTNPVDIRFLTFQIKEISLVLVILGSALIGALVVFLLGAVKQIGSYRQIKDLKRDNKKYADEIKQLKSKLDSLENDADKDNKTEIMETTDERVLAEASELKDKN